MNAQEVVKDYIVNELTSSQDKQNISATDQLIETGIIDSFGIMSLITFVEETFKIKISSDDLMPENFESIQKIADLVNKIKGQG
jgi:acyl carrier protein